MTRPEDFTLIVGAMKAGTTSLFDILSTHPQVSGCQEKEPDFFKEVDASSDRWGDYVARWQWNPTNHRTALEASVAYSKAPWVSDVPRRIASVSMARFRFIYLMRHPIARIESHMRHAIYAGWGQSVDCGIPQDVLDLSRYAFQLDQFMEFFSKDDFLLLTTEELRTNPDGVLERCCRFMGIDSSVSFADVDRPRNAGTFYSMPTWAAALARLKPLRAFERTVLSKRAHDRLRDAMARWLARPDNVARWRLNDRERKAVLSGLATDLERLSGEYGVDTQAWWSLPGSRSR